MVEVVEGKLQILLLVLISNSIKKVKAIINNILDLKIIVEMKNKIARILRQEEEGEVLINKGAVKRSLLQREVKSIIHTIQKKINLKSITLIVLKVNKITK